MLIANIILFVLIFVLLLIFIIIGVLICKLNETISVLLMIAVGLLIPYLSTILVMSKFDHLTYRWYHFIGIFLLIGAMNNGNLRGEASKEAELISTYLFFGTIVMSVLMFWII